MKINKTYRGFTLLEALFAVALIGMVIVALVASSAAFTMTNAGGIDLSTAEFLIEQVRERSAAVSYDDLSSLAGAYNPPRDANNEILMDFNAFSQVVSVSNCGTQFGASAEDFKRVSVTVRKNGVAVAQTEWVRAKLQ